MMHCPTLKKSIFRAYDIRGIVDESLNPDILFLIGRAIATQALAVGENKIVVARDGRLSSAQFSEALIQGLMASGCDVFDIGLAPTPLLYFAAYWHTHGCGVTITGSHNPPNYNGIKMALKGMSITEENIQNLYHCIEKQDFAEGAGHYQKLTITDTYLQTVADNIHLDKPLKIVIDAGNGVSGCIAPALFRKLNCEVIELFCEVDGRFPNHHPDPSQPENLQALIAAVKQHHADIGLAFDGDGDRLGMVTNRGEVINPDRVLMLFAKALLRTQPQAKIIFDVKCTQLLAPLVLEHNGVPIMWKTGHSLIKAKLMETQAQLAGEMSGHFFFRDRWYGFDDALYAGARLVEILSHAQTSSSEMFASIPDSINTPELKVAVNDQEKFSLMQTLIEQANFQEAQEIVTIDGLRINFADGWGLIRPSNTTPCLILRFEAINEIILKNIQHLFREWMLAVKPDLVLPF